MWLCLCRRTSSITPRTLRLSGVSRFGRLGRSTSIYNTQTQTRTQRVRRIDTSIGGSDKHGLAWSICITESRHQHSRTRHRQTHLAALIQGVNGMVHVRVKTEKTRSQGILCRLMSFHHILESNYFIKKITLNPESAFPIKSSSC